MGDQVRCTVRLEGQDSGGESSGESGRGSIRESEGNAHLETETLVFRGGFRLAIPFKEISAISASDGWMSVTFPGGVASFQLGAKAAKWLKAITQPKPVIDKLGVKPRMRVALVDVDDDRFRAQLAERAEVAEGLPQDCDLIFVGGPERAALARLTALQHHLKPDGALWVLRPKGSPDITEMQVLDAGRAAGLVDTKVVAFSSALTAEKFVIPVARRRPVA
ncbi:MAG: hypothetical protein QOH66_119 [Actinomycetota bacterium]|nr:hypothetical protein [Actinomycetota bacterium]